jgi:acetoin utilization protein AcuB
MPTLSLHEAMTPNPISIDAGASLSAAHEQMRRARVRHLPVLCEGRMVGLVSERDLFLLETLPGVDPDQVLVEDAMSDKPYTVDEGSSIYEAVKTMAERKLGSVVVTRKGAVVGIFTAVDALRVLLALLPPPEEWR